MTTTQPARGGNGNHLSGLEAALTAKPAPKPQTPEELAVAHGIASYQSLRTSRDDLQKKYDQLEQLLTISKIEIEGQRAEAATAVSRIEAYQLERDNAIADLAVYQTLFITLQGILRTFGIENAPLVKKIPSPNAQGDNDA
jgi:hypothetical protein